MALCGGNVASKQSKWHRLMVSVHQEGIQPPFLAAQVACWEFAFEKDKKNSQEGLAKKNNSVYFLRGETYHDHHPQLFVGTMYNDTKNSEAMMYVITI